MKEKYGPKTIRRRLIAKIEPYLFLLPAMLLLILFTYYPFINNIVLSFFSVNKYREVNHFVGLGNYINVLNEPGFLQAVGNTFLFAFGTVALTMVISFLLAMLAYKRHRFSAVYEAMFALSMATSMSVIAMIFLLVFDPTMGVANKLFGTNISWLKDTRTAMPALMAVQIWSNLGYNVIFMLSALRGIPTQTLESATLDGATGWRRIKDIILPMISPTLMFLTVSGIAYGMMACTFTLIMTQGNPAGTTQTMMSYVYSKAIDNRNYNTAFAATTFCFLVTSIAMGLSMLFEKKVSYD